MPFYDCVHAQTPAAERPLQGCCRRRRHRGLYPLLRMLTLRRVG